MTEITDPRVLPYFNYPVVVDSWGKVWAFGSDGYDEFWETPGDSGRYTTDDFRFPVTLIHYTPEPTQEELDLAVRQLDSILEQLGF